MKDSSFLLFFVSAVLFVGGAFGVEVDIHQHHRDIPTYSGKQSYHDVKARVAVYPLPVVGEMLIQFLTTNSGCRVVAALPQCGGGMEDRPDCILEPISLTSKTERDGASVSLVTVLIIRVRKPVAFGEDARGRTFQGAYRKQLGNRKSNARGETETSQEEVNECILEAVKNLLLIPELKTAISAYSNQILDCSGRSGKNKNAIKGN